MTENNFSVFWKQDTTNGTKEAAGDNKSAPREHSMATHDWKSIFSVLEAGDDKRHPGGNGGH